MKRIIRTTLTATAAVTLLAACGGAGGAEEGGDFSPRGDVTMLVPFAAGGGSDLAGRATAGALEAANGDLNVNVENKDGGSGAVGYAQFLGESGNGQYLLATETALLALPLGGTVDWTYEDFTPIMKIADDFTLMVAPQDAPYETCTDVVDAAKSERIVAGISGATGLDNVVFTLTEQQTGVEFDRVSFESGGELTAALLGDQIDIASLNPGEVIGQLESGDIKALCAYADERYEYDELKDIPTASEQGIDVSFAQFRGVLAPGGIDDAAKDYWVEQMEAAIETDEYTTYVEDNFLQPNTAAGDEFAAYLEDNNTKLQEVLDK
ncbi:tripartite tricarboxylate transporter substrate binding protein [Nocardioides sediminis]|uniref:tripartite tricarboxylate transporter substrate binding protein n=1 Tax=Nocardioides sediminis TaxID=433648 RepID=UPI001901EC6B|nr:tripartite tricarboxylate transporter substrate binding protein [Nocardioides sediminis]